MPNSECHAFERTLIAALPHALFLPGAPVKALHEFEAKWRIIELLPAKGIADFYCLWASLHVIHLPIRTALWADVKTSATLLAQKAQMPRLDKLPLLVVPAIHDVFKFSAVTHALEP